MLVGPHVSHPAHDAPAGPAGRLVGRLAAARAAHPEMGVFQTFLAGPASSRVLLRPGEAAELKKYLAAHGVLGIAHGSFLDFPWKGAAFPPRLIRQELRICAAAGLRGLVVHLGDQPPGVVARFLPRLLPPPPPGGEAPVLYLETPALKPARAVYETPRKLAALFDRVAELDPEHRRVGLCVDSAHLWSCGVDLRGYAQAAAWLDELEALLRPGAGGPPLLLHLNDSYSGLGSGEDRHAPLRKGLMWARGEPGETGLAAFCEFAVRTGTPCVLERGAAELYSEDFAALAASGCLPPD